MVSSAWDADGNPNTINLPAVAIPSETRPSSDIASQGQDADAVPDGVPRRRRLLRPIRHADVFRRWRWRRLALPPRGP